jgi:hypothetical protein
MSGNMNGMDPQSIIKALLGLKKADDAAGQQQPPLPPQMAQARTSWLPEVPGGAPGGNDDVSKLMSSGKGGATYDGMDPATKGNPLPAMRFKEQPKNIFDVLKGMF